MRLTTTWSAGTTEVCFSHEFDHHRPLSPPPGLAESFDRMEATMSSEPCHDALLALKDCLKQNKPILGHGQGTDVAKQHARDSLLHSFAESLVSLDQHVDIEHEQSTLSFCEQVWRCDFVESGWFSNAQLRQILLGVLHNVQHKSFIQSFLLARLPTVLPSRQDPEQQNTISDIVRSLLVLIHNQPSILLPVLDAFTRFDLSDDCRDQVIDLGIERLSIADSDEISKITDKLLWLVTTDEQISGVWSTLRRRMYVLQNVETAAELFHASTRVSHLLLSTIQYSTVGPWISSSYLKHAGELDRESEVLVLFDIIVLSVLGAEAPEVYSEAAERSLSIWVSQGSYSLNSFADYLVYLSESNEVDTEREITKAVRQRLARSLVRQFLPLLLAPLRNRHSLNGNLMKATDMSRLIVMICHLLSEEERVEVLSSLIQLLHPAVLGPANEPGETAECLCESIIAIMEAVAVTHDAGCGALKDLLVDHLLSSSEAKESDEMIASYCRLIVRILSKSENDLACACQDLMKLVERLLSSGTWGFSDNPDGNVDDTQAIRGILLAKALIECASLASQLSEDDHARLQDWVLRLLVPTTKYLVSPELGSVGLEFLGTYAEKYNNSKGEIFQSLKTVLAHTGLVQRLANHQEEHRILAYTEVADLFASCVHFHDKNSSVRFCIDFYMRRVALVNTVDWKHIIQWVFRLINLYLRLGRETGSRGWRFKGWMIAAIEIPDPTFPANLDDLQRELLRFDEPTMLCDVGFETGIKIYESSDAELLLNALARCALALCLSVAMSAAVMKNASEQQNTRPRLHTDDQDKSSHCLMKFQLWKLLDLRRRLLVTLKAFRALWHVISRSSTITTTKRKRTSRLGIAAFDPTLLGKVEMLMTRLRTLDEILFLSDQYISSSLLADLLFDQAETQNLMQSLEGESLLKGRASIGLIDFMSAQAFYLASWLQHRHQDVPAVPKFSANDCLLLCNFMINCLPNIRIRMHESTAHEALRPLLLRLHLLTVSLLWLLAYWIDANYKTKQWDGIQSQAVDWLRVTDSEHIAVCVLDILALIVMNQDENELEQLVASSWASLHTVYTGESIRCPFDQKPLALSRILKRQYKWSDLQGKKVSSSLDEYWSNFISQDRSAMALRTRLVFHFGILLHRDLACLYLSHLAKVITDVARCASQLRTRSGYLKNYAEDTKTMNHKKVSSPDLPFVAPGTCAEVLVICLNLTVWALAAIHPGSIIEGALGRAFVILSGLFHQLIDIYCESFHALPFQCSSGVWQASQRAIVAGISALHRSLDYQRQASPISGDRKYTGSMAQIKAQLDGLANDIIGRVLSLCDFFGDLERPELVARSKALRQSAYKASRDVTRLAALYNWPAPSFEATEPNLIMLHSVVPKQTSKGFHEFAPPSVDIRMSPSAAGGEGDTELSSEDSFAVAGDWGVSDSE